MKKTLNRSLLVIIGLGWVAIGYTLITSARYRGTRVGPEGATKNRLSRLEAIFGFYFSARNEWPAPSTWKSEMLTVLDKSHVHLFVNLQTDHWGSPVVYIVTNVQQRPSRELRSAGPDRMLGNGDDVVWPLGSSDQP